MTEHPNAEDMSNLHQRNAAYWQERANERTGKAREQALAKRDAELARVR